MIADLLDTFVGVTVTVGKDVIRRHRVHFLGRAGGGVHVQDLVQLVSERGDVPSGVAGVGHAIPPLAGVVESRTELVGLVRRAGVDVVGTFGIRPVVIARTSATDMMRGYDGPLVTFIDQHVDEVAGVAHFGGEESLGVIAQISVSIPSLPPGLFEYLQFLPKNLLGEHRGEGMVVGETEQVEASPALGFAIAVGPAATVTEVAASAELADVVDQGAGVAHGEAAAGEGGQGVARAPLVSVFAIVEAEDVGEIVFGVECRTDAAVILAGFQYDGIPSVLSAGALITVAVPFGPVERLMVVPEASDVDVSVTQCLVARPGHQPRPCQT